jgi:hypothetical protein
MLKDAGGGVYTLFIGRGMVLCVQLGWWFVVNVSWVVVGKSARALGDRRFCV